jgi:outer membrane protein assembly factor BamA
MHNSHSNEHDTGFRVSASTGRGFLSAKPGFFAILAVILASAAFAQEPETRAEALRREREEKARQLEAPEPSRVERLLLDLERGRLFERILNPAEGLYPKLGTITAGSGFSVGPAYRQPGLLGGHADFSAFAMASMKRYWMIETRLRMPRLLDERLVIDLHAQKYDFPEEPFFGLGADSLRTNEVSYGYASSLFGGSASYVPTRWFSLSGGGSYLQPQVSAYDEIDDIGGRFDDVSAPGLADQPDYFRYEAAADVNFREPRGNPREGGRYLLLYQRYDDLEGGRYSFQRVEADLQHYVPLLRNRRVLAFRALVSASDADSGARVPFYLQRTLGGPDDLRGFRRSRFRDTHALLLQAEYRWEIFTAVDGALFYDAGKVASRLEDLDFSDLETDYGIGFRFGTQNGVFLRIEGAFGSREGKHFVFRFGHVF